MLFLIHSAEHQEIMNQYTSYQMVSIFDSSLLIYVTTSFIKMLTSLSYSLHFPPSSCTRSL
jgi:hypothetical protein